MWWINGICTDQISAMDRGLAYGDGLFETMRVVDNQIPLLKQHLDRLRRDASTLGLVISDHSLVVQLAEATRYAISRWPQAVIKLIVTRAGEGVGYRPEKAAPSNIYIRATELSSREFSGNFRVRICDYVLPSNPVLAGIKHLSRLDQVMASRELDDTEDEGILLDEQGAVVEGIYSNLFLVKGNEIMTPVLSGSGVKGVLRDYLLSRAGNMTRYSVGEESVRKDDLLAADEILLTNSIRGIRNVTEISGLWHSNNRQIGDELRQILRDELAYGFVSY